MNTGFLHSILVLTQYLGISLLKNKKYRCTLVKLIESNNHNQKMGLAIKIKLNNYKLIMLPN